jgi:hypothetical protein
VEVLLVTRHPGEPPADRPPSRWAHLPEVVRLEDTISTHEQDAPPDPDAGRDPELGFVLRYAGP